MRRGRGRISNYYDEGEMGQDRDLSLGFHFINRLVFHSFSEIRISTKLSF